MRSLLFNHKALPTILFLCTILFLGCAESKNQPDNIRFVTFTPSKDDTVFFYYPTTMEFDSDSNIIVNDNNRSKIFLFDKNLNYKYEIGRKGRGPGEFNFPRIIGIKGDTLAVRDVSGLRILFYNTNKQFLNSFSYKESIIKAHFIDSLIYFQSLNNVRGSLFSIMNLKGEVIKDFGTPLKRNGKNLNSFAEIIVYTNHIYVLFKHYPILQIYSRDGNFLSEHILNEDAMDSFLETNTGNTRTNNMLQNEYYFLSADIHDGKIYLARNLKHIEIEIYNLDGQFLSYLNFNPKIEDYTLFDIKVSGKKLYVLESYDYPRLGVYEIN